VAGTSPDPLSLGWVEVRSDFERAQIAWPKGTGGKAKNLKSWSRGFEPISPPLDMWMPSHSREKQQWGILPTFPAGTNMRVQPPLAFRLSMAYKPNLPALSEIPISLR
jgi:hypothetical protein